MNGLLSYLADNRNPSSLARRLRQKRFLFVKQLLSSMPQPITILDVGGTETFWETMEFVGQAGIRIVILNVEKTEVRHQGLASIAGDARCLSEFHDKEFDVVFSNSVIEHVGNFAQQLRMASEVRRVGKRYIVQTPNRYFPIEPHFLFPFFQFFPLSLKIFMIRHFALGWFKKTPDAAEAKRIASEITLLNRSELLKLFPGSTLRTEYFCGLAKSFTVYSGWEDVPSVVVEKN